MFQFSEATNAKIAKYKDALKSGNASGETIALKVDLIVTTLQELQSLFDPTQAATRSAATEAAGREALAAIAADLLAA